MNKVYIALGSNLARPVEQLNQAVKALALLPHSKFCAVSSFYRSKPMGPQDQPDYINAVACIKTALPPLELLNELQRLENAQGRLHLRHWGERTLDLDILLYGNLIMQSERLTLPHYDMRRREFVIVPLFEIAPDLILPDGTPLTSLITSFKHHQMTKL